MKTKPNSCLSLSLSLFYSYSLWSRMCSSSSKEENNFNFRQKHRVTLPKVKDRKTNLFSTFFLCIRFLTISHYCWIIVREGDNRYDNIVPLVFLLYYKEAANIDNAVELRNLPVPVSVCMWGYLDINLLAGGDALVCMLVAPRISTSPSAAT